MKCFRVLKWMMVLSVLLTFQAAAVEKTKEQQVKAFLPAAADFHTMPPRFGTTKPEPLIAWAEQAVSGDALLTKSPDKVYRTVRLYGVDAPERGQAFSGEAQLFLINKAIMGNPGAEEKRLTIYFVEGAEAWVYLGNKCLNEMVVEGGFGWWDKIHAPKAARLAQLERSARAAKRGLWKAGNPIPPWQYFPAPKKYEGVESVLQKNFARFPFVPLRYDSQGRPEWRFLTLNSKPLLYEGQRYDGFRIDINRENRDDLVFAFTSLRTWFGQYAFSDPAFSSNIMPRTGTIRGFNVFFPQMKDDYGRLKELKPAGGEVTFLLLSGNRLSNKQQYLIWFQFDRPDDFPTWIAYTYAPLSHEMDDIEGIARALQP